MADEAPPNHAGEVDIAVKRYPLVTFVLLAFGIAWVGWIPAALFGPIPSPLYTLSLNACGPTLAALIVTGLTDGREGLRRLWRRVIAWRFGARCYLFILVSPALLFTAGGLLRSWLGGEPFAWSNAAVYGQAPINPWLLLPVLLVTGLIIGPLNEEIGWRGFALPHLQRRRSPLVATLILGVLWGAWHLPLFYVAGMSQAAQPILPFLVSVLVNSFFYTWLHNHTGGSILPAILLHDTFNTSSAYVPAAPSEWPVIGVTALAVLLIILSNRSSWLTPPAHARTEGVPCADSSSPPMAG